MPWRARCRETGTAGSASGLGKRTGSNPGTAPQADSTILREPAEDRAWRTAGCTCRAAKREARGTTTVEASIGRSGGCGGGLLSFGSSQVAKGIMRFAVRRMPPIPAAPPRPGPVGGRRAQPAPPRRVRSGRQDRDGSRVHCDSLDEGGARLGPCGIATATPQHFTMASRPADENQPGSSPPSQQTGARRSRPLSARFEPVQRLKDVNAGSLRTPFRPARQARAIWQYWPAPALSGPLATLPGATRFRLPSAPPSCCDKISGEGLSPPLESTAPHGADTRFGTRSSPPPSKAPRRA